MAKNLITQSVGDGTTTTFTLSRALTSGYALVVLDQGFRANYKFQSAGSLNVVLQNAPVNNNIVEFWESNDVSDLILNLSGGKSVAYPKTTAGVQTLLPSAPVDRVVQITVEVTTAFANGDGAQPTFKIGQTSTDNKFSDTTMLTTAAVTAKFALGGVLTAGTELIVTGVAATGTTSTGALKVTVSVEPVLPM